MDPKGAVLLVAESDGSASTVNFGSSGVSGTELSRLLEEPLEKLGIHLLPTAGHSPMVGEPLPGLPLADAASATLASDAGARLAITVGLSGRAEGPIRGTQLVGHAVELRIRVLDVLAREAIFDKQLRLSGYGNDDALAHKMAASRAASKLVPALRSSLASRVPRDGAGAAVSIRIRGAQGWREVGAIISKLASTQGVQAVNALEIRADLIRLGVSGNLSAAAIVSSLRRARIPNGTLAVMASGNEISIELTITNTSQPILNG